MSRQHVKITSTGKGGRIEVDGEDVSSGLSGVSVRLDPRELAEVEFHLHLPTVEIDGEYEVRMADATWDTLRSLGWTSPEET